MADRGHLKNPSPVERPHSFVRTQPAERQLHTLTHPETR